jgi:hypothetical protein
MKNTRTIFIVSVLGVSLLSFGILNKSGKAGFTGSPGEGTCAGAACHGSFALNSGPGSVTISTNIPANDYTPGATYQISIKIKQTGQTLFGFGCEVLDSSDQPAGTFTVTDATRTQQLNASNGRPNMTHKLNGGLSNDSAVFTFDWTAPPTNIGDITFYFTGNAANGNGNSSGDYIYSGTYTITSTSTVGINEQNEQVFALSAFTIADQQINVRYALKQPANVQMALVSMDGKIIRQTSVIKQVAGEQNYLIPMHDCMNGTYIVYVLADGKPYSRKVVYTSK